MSIFQYIFYRTCCIYLLCDDAIAGKWFSCLTMAARDSLAGVIQKLCELTHSKWTKFTDQTKKGLLRLVKEMAKMAYGAHSLINVLLRHIVGGELTNQNVWLMETLLDILNEHRAWLERNQDRVEKWFAHLFVAKNRKFCQTCFYRKFWSIIELLAKHRKFCQKSNFWSKIESLVKNRTFGQKSKVW